MRNKLLLSLAFIVTITVVGVVGNAVAGNTPSLGLDLQGGISVTKVPVGEYNRDGLTLTRDRIDERVNSLGIAETEVVLQGDAIVINLPGVRDQQQAIDITNVSGQVFIRPVLQCFAAAPESDSDPTSTTSTTTASSSTSTPPSTTPPTSTTAPTPSGGAGESRVLSAAPVSTTSTIGATTATTTTTTTDASSTTVPGDTTTPTDDTGANEPGGAGDAEAGDVVVSDPTTAQVLPMKGGGQCYVGPASLDPVTGAPSSTGEVFNDDAQAEIQQGAWAVRVGLTGAGQAVWNDLAAQCYSGVSTCPSRQLAIEIDGVVQTAPVVQTPTFDDTVSITGMSGEREARAIANVLRSGALPVRLENASVSAVSATLGKDSLDAAIISGAVGIGLVLLFMLFYYRWLAWVAAAGLALSGGLLWTVVCLLSAQGNLALTLSGAAGIIVSIGVTVDSYVVFFERLKDEVRGGRTLRNSVQRGFHAAWRTILAANVVALIGAIVLWYLSVGSVRGFALFLGLSTVIDMVVAWFFTRPVVLLLARSSWFQSRKVMGIAVTSQREPGPRGVTP